MLKIKCLGLFLVLSIIMFAIPVFHTDVSAATRNLVRNSSMEAGITGWAPLSQNIDDLCYVDSVEAFHGTNSLKMYRAQTLPHGSTFAAFSDYMSLSLNTDYTLTFYAKTDTGTKSLKAFLASYPNGGGWLQNQSLVKDVTIDTQWRRYTVTGKTHSSADKSKFRIQFELNSIGNIWIDAVQLEKAGSSTVYTTKDTFEMGILFERDTGVYKDSETVTQTICVYNEGASAQNLNLNYIVSDMWDATTENRTVNFTINGHSQYKIPINLTPNGNKKGYYRIWWFLKNGGTELTNTHSSFVYTFDHMSDTSLNPNSPFAVSTSGGNVTNEAKRSQALGAKVMRFFYKNIKWDDTEESNNQYNWHDFQVDRVRSTGLVPLLGVNLNVPDWAWTQHKTSSAGGRIPDNLSYWDDWVYNFINHYKSKTTLYEHTNEAAFNYTGNDYRSATTSCYDDIKRADNNAKISSSAPNGPASTNDLSNYSWLDQHFDNNCLSFVDAVAVHPYHQYSNLKPENLEWDLTNVHNMIKNHNNGIDKPIWITEFAYGNTDYDDMKAIPYSEYNYHIMSELQAANYVVRAYVTALSNGVTLMSYLWTEGNTDIVDTTLWGFETSDSNRSIKKIGASYSTMTYMLEGMSFSSKLNMQDNTGSRGYKFTDSSKSVIVAWRINQPGSESIYVGNNPVRVYDLSGNYVFVTPTNGYISLSLDQSPKFIQTDLAPSTSPDLVVTDISWSPANPVNGNAVTFSAKIKNQGTGTSPAGTIHGVGFLVDGTTVAWSDNFTSSLSAGQEVTVNATGGPNGTANWIASAGTHTVRAFVDDVNRIAEIDENNNTRDESLTIGTDTGTLDLVVSDISWSPANPVNGNAVTFSAKIKNQGTGASPAGTIHGVSFMVDGTTVAWSDNYTSSLSAGQEVTVTATGGPNGTANWIASAGTYTVSAFVDDVNRIAEIGENNNTRDESLTIGTDIGTLDLVVSDISWSPANPVNGNAVTFSAKIKNQGTVASPAGTIHGVGFMVDGTTVAWSDNYTSSLIAGQEVTVTATGGPNGPNWTASTGTHTISAFVDDVNRMAESNENNNIFDKSLVVGSGTTIIPVANGDFELSPIDTNGWYRGTWSGSSTYTWATDQKHGGSYSAKIYNASPSDNGGYAKAGNFRVSASANKTYAVGVWIKTNGVSTGGDNGAKFYAQFYDSAGNALGSSTWSIPVTGTMDWTQRSISISSPSNAATIQIEVRLQGVGTVWYDDVTVMQNN